RGVPLVLWAASRTARVRSRRLPPSAALGLANLSSAPRRLAATMSSLALGVAVATAIGVFGLSVRTSLETYASTALPGDIVVSPVGDASEMTPGFPPALVARVRVVPGVSRVDASRTFAVPYGDGTIDIRSNDSLAAAFATDPFVAIVDNAFATRNGLRVDDVVTVLAGGATHRFRLRAIDAGDPLGSGRIDLDDATFARVFSGARPDTLAIVAAPHADVAGVRARIAVLFADRAVEVRTTRDLRASLARRLDGVVRATFALAALGTALAALGIATALSALVLERRAQIRLVRYAGLSRGGVRAMVLYEAATLGALGGVLGTALGIALAVTLLATDRSGFGWIVRPMVPFWLPFAIAPVTASIALLAGIVPARRAARLPMQRATVALVAVVVALACPLSASASTLVPERDVWRVLGHLHASDGTHLDVAATFFRYVERGDAGTVTIVASAASLLDEETRVNHTASRVDRAPNDAPSMRAPFDVDVDVDDWSLHADDIDVRTPALRLRLRDGSTALDVRMRAREPRVDLGANGIVRSGSCAACVVRDAAYPVLDATATRVDGDTRRTYAGTFSLERESGGVRLGDGDRGWQRFTIAFDDGRALFVRVVRTRDGTSRVVGADFISSAGRRTPLAPSDVHVWNSMHTVWRNDRGTPYPSLFAIIVERVHLHCAVVPDLQNQEIVTQGARYYQGSADVERIDPGPRDRGRAFIELTGYDGGIDF
ncbi:MAG: ABC transporter permease, partial [Candidatus Eremiobacteraeota bacterium]|nr:ABC transporter permease [Candidatus Eremiobacteraeota bacterium]